MPRNHVLSLTTALFLIMPCLSHAYTDKQAILAIIGEAESEPMQGKIALAETIRHRGTLKGVYGLKAKRVLRQLYTKGTYNEALKAWEASNTSNLTNGATGWGNYNDIQIFKRQGWFKNCIITKHIGNHYFYKRRG